MVARRQSAASVDIDAATACLADGISKIYGRRDTAVQALRDVTLRIPRSEFTAIMGPSGSGKSTLLHCLAALDTPTSGRVFLGRTELTALSRRQQAQIRRDRIGFVFQAFNLVPTLDAIENITLPQLLAGRRPEQQWLDYVVAQIGLDDRLHHRPSELSGGQQQRVALARALAGRPEVIFADEPTGNLDTAASGEMLRLLRDAVDQFDQTVVVVTHDPSIAGHADRVLFFTDGRVVDETDRPDVDHVLARLRHLDGVGGDAAHGREPTRSNGRERDSMRSRKRRHTDERTPGRPMVGSDDEVEVARQERWLQRIRQQFEAEQPAGDVAHDSWHHDTSAIGQQELAQRSSATVDDAPVDHLDDATAAPAAAPQRFNGTPPHAAQADRRDDGGWLPPERSWEDLVNHGEPVHAPDERDTAPDERDTAPAEPAPWSRPQTDDEPAAEYTQPPGHDSFNDTGGDPWAPADRSRAEDYHHEAGGSRRSRGRPADDDRWTTSPPWSSQSERDHQIDDRAGRDAPPADERGASQRRSPVDRDRDTGVEQPQHDPGAYDRWQPPQPAAAGNGSTHRDDWEFNATRHDNGTRDSAGTDIADDRRHPRRDRDEAAHHERPAEHTPSRERHEPREQPQPADHTDPWNTAWDGNHGPDAAEVWTPTFDSGQPAFGTEADAEFRRSGRSDDDRLDDQTDVTDDRDRDATPVGEQQTPAPADEPAPRHERTPAHEPPPAPADEPAPRHERTPAYEPPPAPAHTPEPAAAHEPTSAHTSEPAAAHEPTPASATSHQPTIDPTNGRQATTSQTDRADARAVDDVEEVPPALASLRQPRRPDQTADPLEALQSLQAQLERLGSGRRARRPEAAPARPRGSGTDTDRRERR